MKAAVFCFGNELVGDDAVAIEIYHRLQERMLPSSTRLACLGLAGLSLLDEFSAEDLVIIVDALQSGREAGTVHVEEIFQSHPHRCLPITSHDIGIEEVLEIGKKLCPKSMPKRVFLIGIEGKCFDQLGVPLSPEVERAIEPSIDNILELLHHESSQEFRK